MRPAARHQRPPAEPILAVIRPRVLQRLGLILGIIQLALWIGLLFTAVEVQAPAIKELLG